MHSNASMLLHLVCQATGSRHTVSGEWFIRFRCARTNMYVYHHSCEHTQSEKTAMRQESYLNFIGSNDIMFTLLPTHAVLVRLRWLCAAFKNTGKWTFYYSWRRKFYAGLCTAMASTSVASVGVGVGVWSEFTNRQRKRQTTRCISNYKLQSQPLLLCISISHWITIRTSDVTNANMLPLGKLLENRRKMLLS